MIFILFASGTAFNVLKVFVPIFQGKMVDSLINGDDFKTLLNLAFMYLMINLIVQFFRFVKRMSNRTFAKNLAQDLREIIYNNIIFLNIADFSKKKIGDLMSFAISDVDIVVNGFRKISNEVFDTGILMISYIVTMYYYDKKITTMAILFIPFSILLSFLLKKVIYRYNNIYRAKSSELTGLTFQIVENFIPFRIYAMEDINEKIFKENADELEKKAVKKTAISTSLSPIYSIIACIGVIPIIYFGGLKVIDGVWTIGTFSAYFSIALALFLKSAKASVVFNVYAQSKVSWNRILPYLDNKKELDKSIENVKEGDTSLEVKDLSFSYGLDENIIENISFSAKSGEIIGVTGEIATGKSALLSAFMNFYPYGGSIKVDGLELNKYSQFETSYIFSYLLHDAQLFSDSIEHNIAFDDKVNIEKVLNDVCFLEDIENMPDGIDTVVGNNGVRLSGGQMARVATARTLAYRNGITKKIIILDDPFSALDMKTENNIIENLRTKYKDSIIIIISHRLAIFDKIDKVILLEKDKKHMVGTHAELLDKSQTYRSIYSLQKGGIQ